MYYQDTNSARLYTIRVRQIMNGYDIHVAKPQTPQIGRVTTARSQASAHYRIGTMSALHEPTVPGYAVSKRDIAYPYILYGSSDVVYAASMYV